MKIHTIVLEFNEWTGVYHVKEGSVLMLAHFWKYHPEPIKWDHIYEIAAVANLHGYRIEIINRSLAGYDSFIRDQTKRLKEYGHG